MQISGAEIRTLWKQWRELVCSMCIYSTKSFQTANILHTYRYMYLLLKILLLAFTICVPFRSALCLRWEIRRSTWSTGGKTREGQKDSVQNVVWFIIIILLWNVYMMYSMESNAMIMITLDMYTKMFWERKNKVLAS